MSDKYRDISWLMELIDLEEVLDRLGVTVVRQSGESLVAYCPDHHLYVDREPSHPKWYIYTETGQTICFTEDRKSNLVYTAARLLECSHDEAARFIVGSDWDAGALAVRRLRYKLKGLRGNGKSKLKDSKPKVRLVNNMEREVERGFVLDSGFRYFWEPPGKSPTNITSETVKAHCVFQRTWGFYNDRVIIPFFQNAEIVGFVANDILGAKEWVKRHPGLGEDDYKKVLYPKNMGMTRFLYGIDDLPEKVDEVVLVEGARDKMKLTQEGFYALALLHSGLSDEQLALLTERAPKRIFVMMDGDPAGVAASEKIAERLVQFFSTFIVQTPDDLDPKNLDKTRIKRLFEQAEEK